ncbi:MAG: LysR family transcriptional regulator [Burkholderiaceae bacterium]|nr:LysR family transcriptional regulator [Burkholderiaceae bacterium]
MSTPFNYKHLYYFWVVAQEGGMTRAADKLGMAVQTVSAQVRELERALGFALLKPSGRGLVLTAAGAAALKQADLIFQLGGELPARVRNAASAPEVRLAVGVSDGLPKLIVHRLLHPVLSTPHLRLLCHEGELDDLLGDLALHRLDVVLSDRPAPPNHAMRLYSHRVGTSPVAWYGCADLVHGCRDHFPHSLRDTPVLLPTAHAAMRERLDRWFDAHDLRPRIAGEFEDSALLKTFGASGMGLFPASEWVHADLEQRYAVHRLATIEGVTEHYFAIDTEKRVKHPLVQRVLPKGA